MTRVAVIGLLAMLAACAGQSPPQTAAILLEEPPRNDGPHDYHLSEGGVVIDLHIAGDDVICVERLHPFPQYRYPCLTVDQLRAWLDLLRQAD